MMRLLSLRDLRQNPTAAIDAAERGDTVVITRRSRPIADLVPHVSRSGVAPAKFRELMAALGPDPAWSAEVRENRAQPTRDVWGDKA